MAVWGIDIGHSALKAVRVNKVREGLEIDQVAYFPIEGGESEGDRPASVAAAIKTFLQRHPIRGERVVVSLPGLHAFSRFIKLPPVDAKKVDEMVVFEAQQQIPFPIDEVMWGYHKVEKDYAPGEEIEVGLFAARKELFLGFLSELRENGIQPDQVTIAPLAIYNFVTYNAPVDEETLILDIGAKHTDLVLVKGANFFLRNVRLAGSDVTEALSSRFKIPTHEAEKLKRQGSASKNSDKIFTSLKQVLKDMAGEVHRSVAFFRQQAGELSPKRVLLLGDGSKLKNLPEFLESELKMKVEKVSKLEQDKFVVGENVDFDILRKHILAFGEALGLAVQGLGLAKTSLNLLPQEDQIVGELKRKLPFAAATAAVCWIAVLVSYVYWSGILAEFNETLASTSKVGAVKREHDEALAAENFEEVSEKSKRYRTLMGDRLLMLRVVNKLRDALPTQNDKIYMVDVEKRASLEPVDQKNEILPKREELLRQKWWLLDLKVTEVGEAPAEGAAPGAPTKGPKGLRVELLVARYWPSGTDRPQLFNQVKAEVGDRIEKLFADAPFWVRKPGQIRLETDSPAIELGAAEGEIFALDRNVRQSDIAGIEPLKCVAFPIRFEVGFKPQVPKPAEGGGS